ncbi:MAG: hypothetical protein ACM3N1_00260 [Accumulibacter sp.]
MKMSHVFIGPASTIGQRSVVLYDSEMKAGSQLGNFSLLMKGEILAEGSRWEGSPAKPMPKLNPLSQVKTTLIKKKNEILAETDKWEGSSAKTMPKLIPMSKVKPALPLIKGEILTEGNNQVTGLISTANAEADADVIG